MTNDTKKVVVTGGSGKAGRVCVGDLIAHGYQVFNVHLAAIPASAIQRCRDLQQQYIKHLQRFRGGAAPWNQEYRLGFERDSPWIAVRYAATLRSGG